MPGPPLTSQGRCDRPHFGGNERWNIHDEYIRQGLQEELSRSNCTTGVKDSTLQIAIRHFYTEKQRPNQLLSKVKLFSMDSDDGKTKSGYEPDHYHGHCVFRLYYSGGSIAKLFSVWGAAAVSVLGPHVERLCPRIHGAGAMDGGLGRGGH